MKKIWYVDLPSYVYEEDVKALARENDLKIIDSRFKGDNKQCANAPKLTVKGEPKPKRKRAVKTKKES